MRFGSRPTLHDKKQDSELEKSSLDLQSQINQENSERKQADNALSASINSIEDRVTELEENPSSGFNHNKTLSYIATF